MVVVVLLTLSWLVPLHFPPWVSWHSEVVAFFAVFLLSWYGLVREFRAAGPRDVALPIVALPFVGLALVAVLQRAAGLMTFWGDVWAVWFYVVLCVTCLMLGYAAATPAAQPRAETSASASFTLLAFALLAGALASTFIAFAQVFSLWEHSEWIVRMPNLRRPGGNLAQPNHLATLLVMGIASLVFLYESGKQGGIASGLMLIILSIGLAAAESRTGLLAVSVLLLWWLAKRRHLGSKIPAWVAGVAGGGFALCFWAWPRLLNTMLLTHQAGVDTASSLRLEVWSQLLEAVALRPWWGWGIHEVAKAHNAVAHGYAVSMSFTYSHNIVLDMVLWFGLPMTGILLLVIGNWLWHRLRAANQLLPWYGLAVALPVAVHSMLEFPFAYAYMLVPVMFALGTVEALLGVKPALRIEIKRVAAMLLVTTAALVWSIVEYLQIEEDFRVARFEALRIGSPPHGHRRPEIMLYTQLGVLLDDARITPTPDMSPEAMQVVKNSALHYPWSATQYRYAVALALNGNTEEAARQIQLMRRMWGEKFYEDVKKRIQEQADNKYPVLRRLSLP